MMDDLLRYEEIHHQIKELEAEKKKLASVIRNNMIEQNADETPPLQSGKIILVSKKNYEYSDTVDKLLENVDKVKQQEVHDGIAEVKEIQFIKYSGK